MSVPSPQDIIDKIRANAALREQEQIEAFKLKWPSGVVRVSYSVANNYHRRGNVRAWTNEHVQGLICSMEQTDGVYFGFSDSVEAFAFKLRWG